MVAASEPVDGSLGPGIPYHDFCQGDVATHNSQAASRFWQHSLRSSHLFGSACYPGGVDSDRLAKPRRLAKTAFLTTSTISSWFWTADIS